MQECTRCILDESIPHISFDAEGVCNYCRKQEEMDKKYLISEPVLDEQVKRIKEEGKDQRYDAIIGVSGGADSSYLMKKMAEKNVRMLGVHFDNGWNTGIAENNIEVMTKKLNIDFIRFKMDPAEFNDLNKSFLYASVPDADIPNDMALVTCLYIACEAFGVKTILDGHSFRTEGFMPLGWSYMDGGYIESVQEQFGTVPIKTLPNLEFHKWIHWLELGIERFRGLYHIEYVKERAKKELHDEFGWKWYGGHHNENIYTKFVGNYLRPRKFKIDPRRIEYSALVRSGQLTCEEAKERAAVMPTIENDEMSMVLDRLGLTKEDLEEIMEMPVKSHHDYGTYHQKFKQHKDTFYRLFKQGLIPETFYLKYVEQ